MKSAYQEFLEAFVPIEDSPNKAAKPTYNELTEKLKKIHDITIKNCTCSLDDFCTVCDIRTVIDKYYVP